MLGVTLDLFAPLSAAASALTRCVSVEAVGRAESKRGTVDQTRRQRQQGYDLTMQGDVNKGNLGFSIRSATPLCALVIISDSEEQSTLPLDIHHVRSLPYIRHSSSRTYKVKIKLRS